MASTVDMIQLEREHHQRVETILEDILLRKATPEHYRIRYEQECTAFVKKTGKKLSGAYWGARGYDANGNRVE